MKHGIFETLLILRGKPLFYDEHVRRMNRSAKALGWAQIRPDFRAKVAAFLHRRRAELGKLNFFLKAGDIRPTLQFHALPPAQVFPRRGKKPVWVALARETRHTGDWHGHKSVRRAFNDLIRKKYRRGRVWEVLFFNENRRLVEGSRCNVFFVTRGRLVTPRLSDSPLGGITREKVLQLARALKIPVAETTVDAKTLQTADEIFITSSLRGILPVSRVTSVRAYPAPGPVTRKLQSAFTRIARDNVSRFLA